MPTVRSKGPIPPERIRGYARLAPEYGQFAVNVAANFCDSVVKGLIPFGSLAPELQARMTREQIKAALVAEFDKVAVGAWPSDYGYERFVVVLCDDSVRITGQEEFRWPEDVTPLRRRVIIEFVWHFSAPRNVSVPCTFWISCDGPAINVCKFAHERLPL